MDSSTELLWHLVLKRLPHQSTNELIALRRRHIHQASNTVNDYLILQPLWQSAYSEDATCNGTLKQTKRLFRTCALHVPNLLDFFLSLRGLLVPCEVNERRDCALAQPVAMQRQVAKGGVRVPSTKSPSQDAPPQAKTRTDPQISAVSTVVAPPQLPEVRQRMNAQLTNTVLLMRLRTQQIAIARQRGDAAKVAALTRDVAQLAALIKVLSAKKAIASADSMNSATEESCKRRKRLLSGRVASQRYHEKKARIRKERERHLEELKSTIEIRRQEVREEPFFLSECTTLHRQFCSCNRQTKRWLRCNER